MKWIQKYALLLALSATVLFAGCKKEEINPDGTPPAGSFKAYMTDAPADYEELNVQIVKVEAFVEGRGWVMLNNDTRTVNVLKLTNGAQMELTSASEAKSYTGVYSKMRITFGDNNTLKLNAAAALDLGGIGGAQVFTLAYHNSGPKTVEIEIDKSVTTSSGASVLLDFNAAQSVYYDVDRFVLRPVITEIKNSATGVRGHVEGTLTASVTIVSGSNSFTSFVNANGDFLIRGMDEGVYDLTVMPAQVLEGLDPQPKTISGVVVANGEITSVGTINF